MAYLTIIANNNINTSNSIFSKNSTITEGFQVIILYNSSRNYNAFAKITSETLDILISI